MLWHTNIIRIPYNKHSIAHPFGRVMGCLLRFQTLFYVLHPPHLCFMQCYVICSTLFEQHPTVLKQVTLKGLPLLEMFSKFNFLNEKSHIWSKSPSKLLSINNKHGRDGVSNLKPHDCLLNRLFKVQIKETSKLRVTGLCEGNSPVTGEFPAQRASNAEHLSIW